MENKTLQSRKVKDLKHISQDVFFWMQIIFGINLPLQYVVMYFMTISM